MRRVLALLTALLLAVVACSSEAVDDAASSGSESTESSVDEIPASAEEPSAATTGAPEPEPESEVPESGGEITYGVSDNGTGFDTTSLLVPGALRIVAAINDPLVRVDGEGRWEPWLAESLTPDQDATVWTIRLRPDVTFHDGEPVDAVAVKANLDAARASPSVGFALADIDSVEVVDPFTLDVAMKRPWAAFPYLLVSQPGYMVSPSTIGTNDDFVGTGPFMLESWVQGDSARVVANPNYWRTDEGSPYLDAVSFKVAPQANTRRRGLESGDLDLYAGVAAPDIVDFRQTDDVDVHVSNAESNEFLLLLNTTVAPVDDIRVRRALATAIDRQLLIDTFQAGLPDAADSFLSPAHRYWIENGYPAFDLDAAAALIDAYEAENGPVTITITTVETSPTLQMVEVIASFWSDVGVDVSIETIGESAVVGRAVADDFQAMIWFQFSFPDPDGEYVFFHSGAGPLNWSNLSDPDIDAALDVGRESADEATRAEAYATLQQQLAEELPALWIYHLAGIEAVAADPSVRGFADPEDPASEGAALVFGSFHGFGELWLQTG